MEHQHVFQHAYGLHAIILSRSPFLAHLMSTVPPAGIQRVIYVPLEHEPEVTQEVRSPLTAFCSITLVPILTFALLFSRVLLSVPFISNVLNPIDLITPTCTFPSAWLLILSDLSQSHPS